MSDFTKFLQNETLVLDLVPEAAVEVCKEAADTIEAQDKRIAELEAELQSIKKRIADQYLQPPKQEMSE